MSCETEKTPAETVTTEPTVELLFSRSGVEYYVVALDYHRPTAWLSVEPGEDGKYKVWPFAYYSIKSGETRMVPESDPLVQRYAEAEEWPARGSTKWRVGLTHKRRQATEQLEAKQRDVAFWEKELARLDALLAAVPS